MTKLYKYAYDEDLKKVLVIELEAKETEGAYWVTPITNIYKCELDTFNSSGVMYSLKNDVDTYIKNRIEWEKNNLEKHIEESKKLIAETENILKNLCMIDREKDVKYFDTVKH